MSVTSYHVPERLHADRSKPVVVHADTLSWTPSPQAGVERRFLERQGGEVAQATSIVRYAANSSFPGHVHDKGEEFLVLEGVFCDQRGDYPVGTYVRNPPGSGHTPFTRQGCVIFVKLRQMPDDETEILVRSITDASPIATDVAGLRRMPLFDCPGRETVSIECLDPRTDVSFRRAEGGEELLVLDGTLVYGQTSCPPMTWLRIPSGLEQRLFTQDGCRYWVKRGHLPR